FPELAHGSAYGNEYVACSFGNKATARMMNLCLFGASMNINRPMQGNYAGADMRKLIFPVAYILAIAIAVMLSTSAWAQPITYITPVEIKGQFLRGSIAVAQHENDGMIGI